MVRYAMIASALIWVGRSSASDTYALETIENSTHDIRVKNIVKKKFSVVHQWCSDNPNDAEIVVSLRITNKVPVRQENYNWLLKKAEEKVKCDTSTDKVV